MADTIDDDGLSIVLSPVQLAAVLQGSAISPPETAAGRLWNRTTGGLRMVGGAIELVAAGGLFLAPEPTAVTKAGGVVLGLNGLDNTGTGAVQLWTGHPARSLTEQTAAAAARSLGLAPDDADTVGVVVDIAVPLVVSGILAASRIAAIRSGGIIDLAAEEAAGGHTILKHVGKDEAFLRNRLLTEPKIPAAGTFKTLAIAEKFVSKAIQANQAQILTWVANGARGTLPLVWDAGEVVGVTIPRLTNVLQNARKVTVVLRRTTIANKIYYVLTSYPSL